MRQIVKPGWSCQQIVCFAKYVMLVPNSICLVMKRGKSTVKNKEGGREQMKQVLENLVKELKAVIPVQPKLFGCRQACSARCSLLHMACSDLPSQGKSCLPMCLGRTRECVTVFHSETLMFMQNIKPGIVTAVQFCLK